MSPTSPRRPSVSRWGRSSYDTDADLAAEAAALDPIAEVRGMDHDADILVVPSGTRVDASLLVQAPSARLVITTTSGYDHLHRQDLSNLGIHAARMPLVRRDAVVESSLELLVAGLRQSGWLRAQARAGRWARGSLPSLAMRTVRGSTIVVVGLGVIGTRMARVLTALGARVLGVDPLGVPEGIERADLDDALREADAVTLHCHLTATTHHLLHRDRLLAAQPGLVVVNTARGPILDLPDAVQLLEQGHLAAVGVDVFEEEPYPQLALCADLPGLHFTPHSAGYSDNLPAAVRRGLTETVRRWASGEPLPFPVPLPAPD